jgi:Ca-activated chloride channel family protein
MIGTDLTFLRPVWLLALPALAILGAILWRRQGALGDWARAADSALLAALVRLGQIDADGTRRPLILALAAAALVILGLAGPAVERRDTLSWRNLDGVLIVVDASDSLTGSRDWTGVLAAGRFAIGALGSRPGGIIVYAGDAYVASDLTLDHRQLGQTLSLIGPDTVPDPGSAPARALAMATSVMAAAGVIAGDVVLLTDGGGLGTDALRAASEVAQTGARLSVVSPASSPLIRSLVEVGGGHHFAPDAVEAIGRFLKDDARTRLERQDYPLLFWHDLGRWLVVLALVPVALMFRGDAASGGSVT